MSDTVTFPAQSRTENLKVPPHSVEAEQAVIGGLLLDNRAWEQIADKISVNDFYRQDHRLLFNAIAALEGKNQPFDVVTLSEWLEQNQQLEDAGGLAYLARLAKDTPSAANILAYAEIVRERSILRQLIAVGTDISQSGFQPGGRESRELLEEAEKKVFAIADQDMRSRGGFQDIKSLLTKTVERIDHLFETEGAVTGLATGFDKFDEMTTGLQPGDLVIVAGRPSMGKTTFAMNIAENAAIGHKTPVAVFSMEMPGEQLAMRMISSLGRIDQHHIRTGQLTDEDWPRITSAVHMLSEANLFIDDTPAMSPGEIRAKARRMKRKHGLGLIVVDYLQLMQVAGGSENRATEISEISRGLKALAKELHVPVVALSQLNRSLEQRVDKRPIMSDLRECVTGDTLVMCANGQRKPVRDLVGECPAVLAVDDKGKIVTATSDKVWCVGKKPVYRIKLASGRTITATKEHRLYGAAGWVTVNDLAVDDRLALARYLPEPEQVIEWPDDEVILLGHLIGDGSYLTGQPLRYSTNSEENSDIVTQSAQRAFNVTVNRHNHDSGWHQLVFSGNGNRWHPAGMNLWLRNLGIFNQRSHEKHLPDEVFSFSTEKIILLLRHLWATDGCVKVRKTDSKGGHSVYYATNSKRLSKDVAALLLRLGIVARIYRTKKQDYKPGYQVHVCGHAAQKAFVNQVGGFGPRAEDVLRLKKRLAGVTANTNVDTVPKVIFDYVKEKMLELGISQRKMASMRGTSYGGTSHFRFDPSRGQLLSYAELLNDQYLRDYATSDIFWDRITDIQPAGEQEVFDLTVPDYHSWLADGIVSHNSGAIEQDADLIVFIYRDEVYNEDSPQKGIAEIIISKQRNGPIGKSMLTFLGKYTRFENFVPEIYTHDYEGP